MIVDIITLVVLLASAVIAFLRGVIRETLTILAIVGGVVAAWALGPLAQPLTRSWFGVPVENADAAAQAGEGEKSAPLLFDIIPYSLVADVLAYGVIFAAVVVALSIISHFLSEAAKSGGLGPVDRTLGVVFGLARGIILLALFYLPIHLYVDQERKDSWFKDSHTHVYIEMVAEKMTALLPQDAEDKLKTSVTDAAETAGDARKALERIDVLAPKGKGGEQSASPPSDADLKPVNPEAKPESGYNEKPRQDLKNLIEEQQKQP